MKHKEFGPFHRFEYENLSEFEADINIDFYWDETEIIMKNVRDTLRDGKKRTFIVGACPFTVVRHGLLYVYMVEDETVAQMVIEEVAHEDNIV